MSPDTTLNAQDFFVLQNKNMEDQFAYNDLQICEKTSCFQATINFRLVWPGDFFAVTKTTPVCKIFTMIIDVEL